MSTTDKPKIYLAPMEGITTYVYRRAQAAVYGSLDKYFTPFLEPHEKRSMKKRELQEILPENNGELYTVPQILTSSPEGFLSLAGLLKEEYGYQEINLNLGCPSRTVVSKGKGSGFLAEPERLSCFLDTVFDAAGQEMKISVKTRLGLEDPEEFPALLKIFNQYPLEELIIHPRVQKDYYGNGPRFAMFEWAETGSRCPVCYNGDLFTEKSLENFCRTHPGTNRLMLGRGLLLNPGLAAERVDEKEEKQRFRRFHAMLLDGYRDWDMGDRNVLFKLKELWFYQIHLFEGGVRYAKQIRKSQSLSEYEAVVGQILEECPLCPPEKFQGFCKQK